METIAFIGKDVRAHPYLEDLSLG